MTIPINNKFSSVFKFGVFDMDMMVEWSLVSSSMVATELSCPIEWQCPSPISSKFIYEGQANIYICKNNKDVMGKLFSWRAGSYARQLSDRRGGNGDQYCSGGFPEKVRPRFLAISFKLESF